MLLAGCGGGVPVDVPELPADRAAACERLLAALPERLDDLGEDGLDRVPVSPEDATAAAYGDPPVVVTCGVGRPETFDRFSQCQEVDGIGWFVPEDQVGDEPVEVTLTAVGYRPRVQVVLPPEYWPMGAPSVTAVLADPVGATLRLAERCR